MQAISGPQLDWNNARLMIKKSSKTVSFFVTSNSSWEKLGELDISKWSNSIYIGIATLSHDNNQLTKAQYSEIELQKQ
jgi:hypothetical protein